MSSNKDERSPSDRIDFDPETGSYRVEFDWRTESLSEVVVSSVSAVTDRDVTELSALNAVVDPEALDDLFAPTASGRPREGGRLSFAFEGHEVVVRRDGTLVVRPPDRDS